MKKKKKTRIGERENLKTTVVITNHDSLFWFKF